jgi:hypothetical protein
MEDEIRGNLGNRTDLDSSLVNYINFAQDMMARQYDFEELEIALTDAFTHALATWVPTIRPKSIHSLRLIDGSNSRKLQFIPHRLWDEILPDVASYSEGRCTHYTLFNATIEVYPIPDSAYVRKTRYSGYPTTLLDASPALTSDFIKKDDIIICLATSWAFRRLGNIEKMNFWANQGWTQLREDILTESRRPDEDILPTQEIQGIMGEGWKDPFIKQLR